MIDGHQVDPHSEVAWVSPLLVGLVKNVRYRLAGVPDIVLRFSHFEQVRPIAPSGGWEELMAFLVEEDGRPMLVGHADVLAYETSTYRDQPFLSQVPK